MPEELCDDEGCPHYGTPHTCISRPPRPSCNGHERIYEDGSGYICRHCGIDMDDED